MRHLLVWVFGPDVLLDVKEKKVGKELKKSPEKWLFKSATFIFAKGGSRSSFFELLAECTAQSQHISSGIDTQPKTQGEQNCKNCCSRSFENKYNCSKVAFVQNIIF